MVKAKIFSTFLWIKAIYILNRTDLTSARTLLPIDIWTGRQSRIEQIKNSTQRFVLNILRFLVQHVWFKSHLAGCCPDNDVFRIRIHKTSDSFKSEAAAMDEEMN